MDCLKAFIDQNKGRCFDDMIDQFMYGSLLETMRDLLVKILRAVMGPSRRNDHVKEMDDRLAKFLKGVDGSGNKYDK